MTASNPEIPISGIPDAYNHLWVFPLEIDEIAPLGFEVEIDLHSVHPFPVKDILLLWSGTELPKGYSLLYANETHEYRDADVPDIEEGLMSFNENRTAAIPIPVVLDPEGANVQYIKLVFPKGSLQDVHALEEMRFEFVWAADGSKQE